MNVEQNLKWLQEFYVAKLLPLNFSLNLLDEQLLKDRYLPFCDAILTLSMLQVNSMNPGWGLDFGYDTTICKNVDWSDININTGIRTNDNWLFAVITDKNITYFNSASGQLYLSVLLECLRCFIEGIPLRIDDLVAFRENLKEANPLLCWLEEFYTSCCMPTTEFDIGESAIGIDFISVTSGWIMVFSFEDNDLGDKPFEEIRLTEAEGEIRLYKIKQKIIIRTHFRGLIRALSLFKDWAEIYRGDAW